MFQVPPVEVASILVPFLLGLMVIITCCVTALLVGLFRGCCWWKCGRKNKKKVVAPAGNEKKVVAPTGKKKKVAKTKKTRHVDKKKVPLEGAKKKGNKGKEGIVNVKEVRKK